ncbi:MAG: hypothetical protein GYB33_05810 [Gammaproteobacteria bacterium]|uniref:DUF6482 family protein n=1 Tax=Pseudomaricurvus alcaniphilus TaxID=1166482 RepID=UPI00140A16B7|nr:DUF6482 family protein [Pseudomaricurvus alcaniphilus]MBR9909853.1 hypothetical protein [Gammaproteobacteria bacterium]NHN38579.1 hypothetical protein [Pseudomaricurvus alcaniphilus]
MKITLQQLQNITVVDKLIIHSLDLCLYQVSAIIAGEEYYVTDVEGKFLRSHNKLDLQAQLAAVPAQRLVLHQRSAYDEMVGQPLRQADNVLEVDLGNSELARPGPAKDLH